MKKLLFLLPIAVSLLLVGCEKDSTKPDPSGALEPKIFLTDPTYKEEGKSVYVSVSFAWTTENTVKASMENSSIKIPQGDTTITMKKGETKKLAFVVENTSGVKNYKYLTVDVPADPIPPTFSAYFTYNEQRIDTLPYLGGNIKLVVNFSNGVLELNGVMYENSPVVFDFTVTETKTYDFKVIGAGGEIVPLNFIVPVYVPTEWELLITNSKGWICDYNEGSYSINGKRSLIPNNFTGTAYFYLVPQKTLRYLYPCISGSGTCVNEGPWSLNGQILSDGSDMFIETLTQTEMVWREKGIAMIGDTVVDYYTWRHLVHPN